MKKEIEVEILDQINHPDTRNQGLTKLILLMQEKTYWMVRKIVISHDDTNDLVQNIFIKVINHIHEFKSNAALSTWIYKVALNEALTFIRAQKRKNLIPWYSYEKKLADTLIADPYFCANDISVALHKALLSLPEKQRLVFNLRYYDELSYEEIADITGTSIGALKASYHLAYKKIEKYITSI